MTNEPKKQEKLPWHPAFFAGIQIEFEEEAHKLTFENEHQLGTACSSLFNISYYYHFRLRMSAASPSHVYYPAIHR